MEKHEIVEGQEYCGEQVWSGVEVAGIARSLPSVRGGDDGHTWSKAGDRPTVFLRDSKAASSGNFVWLDTVRPVNEEKPMANKDIKFKAGDRVRVTEIQELDSNPMHQVGEIVTLDEEPAQGCGWEQGYLLLMAKRARGGIGTWCKLELVEEEPKEVTGVVEVGSCCGRCHQPEGKSDPPWAPGLCLLCCEKLLGMSPEDPNVSGSDLSWRMRANHFIQKEKQERRLAERRRAYSTQDGDVNAASCPIKSVEAIYLREQGIRLDMAISRVQADIKTGQPEVSEEAYIMPQWPQDSEYEGQV